MPEKRLLDVAAHEPPSIRHSQTRKSRREAGVELEVERGFELVDLGLKAVQSTRSEEEVATSCRHAGNAGG